MSEMNDKERISVQAEIDQPTIPGDPPVYYTQVWLNKTFGANSSWVHLDEDGITGWNTIYGLVRALQIYLNVSADGDFGNGTKTAFESKYARTNGVLIPTLQTEDLIYGIISGALWCKGYYGSYSQEINCKLDGCGAESIYSLKDDAGINENNYNISSLLMKSLLSMDQFVLLKDYGGKPEIRSIQQYLNANYGSLVGIIPCDGIYQRQMNAALIKILQYVEGFRGSDVDGIFGNGTKAALPQLSPSNQPPEAVRLFCFALTCNGYAVAETSWVSDVVIKTKEFQAKHYITENGLGDTDTWMALLLSKGNPSRAAQGCDCATILDAAKASALYNAGYRYVGRYVSGTVGSGAASKALTRSEMTAIFNAGLRIFAIYQEGGTYLERYTYETGLQDAQKAINAAVSLGIPTREYIYFAVDYDVLDGYIPTYVVPYFQAINEVMEANKNKYNIGIYGSRNVCIRICSEYGLASSSFVGDMATAYSGNMGFTIPENWAFDQFDEYTFTGGGASFALDKDAVSGRYLGFNSFESANTEGKPVSEKDKLNSVYNILSRCGYSNILGSSTEFDWGLDLPPIPLGVITLKASYTESTLFNLGSDQANYCTFNINNGDIPSIDLTYAESLFGSLEADFKASIGLENIEFVSELVQDIENGKLSLGAKVTSDNEIAFYIVIEHYLGQVGDIDNSVSVKLEIVIEDNDGDLSQKYNEAAQKADVAYSVILVALEVSVAICFASAIASVTLEFIALLLAWLGMTFA